jgi:hypothetical protein
MLPKGMEIAAHVTHAGQIKLSITLEPSMAPSAISTANTLLAVAREALARQTARQFERQADAQAAVARLTIYNERLRLALSIYRRTRKKVLACRAASIGRVDFDVHFKQCKRIERAMHLVARNRRIITAALAGDLHAEIADRHGLHEKSVSRIVGQAKQGNLALACPG